MADQTEKHETAIHRSEALPVEDEVLPQASKRARLTFSPREELLILSSYS